MPRVLLRAKAQQQLFKFFWMRVRSLRAGSLNGHGLPGRTIVGAKGIGKTQAAEAFVNVVESILPDVIGVYVDMKTPAGTHLATGTFLNGLEAHLLSARSLSVSKRDMLKSPEVQLMKALRDNNKYLFLFVDELDEFYRNDPKDNHVATIQELAALGESSSGRVTTVLCGSSAYLGDLIRRRTTESIKIRFNLTTGGIVDLNGSKYRTTRIDSNLPTDLDCVVAIFRAQVSDFPVEEVDPETMGNVRQVAFEAGAIVRDVQSQIELEQGGGAASLRGISQSITTVRPLNAVETALYNGFLEATANKNRRLFNELMQGERETEMIRTIPWETRFEPLNWAELEALWISIDGETKAIECSKAGGLDRVPKSTLEETLLDLADHSWVVIGEVADGRPKNVYPLAMSSVRKKITEQRRQMGVFQSAWQKATVDNLIDLGIFAAKSAFNKAFGG